MSEDDRKEDCSSLASPNAAAQYDVPRSNPYMALSLCTTNKRSPEERNRLDLANLRSPDDEREPQEEPQYASPDEMKVISNKAYAANGRSLAQQSGNFTEQVAETNYYTLADDTPLKADTLVPRRQPRDETNQQLCCPKALCFAICTIAFFLAIGLSGASLTIVLLSSTASPSSPPPQQPCSCLPSQQQDNPQLTTSLLAIERRLNQTNEAIEQGKLNVRTLTRLVTEISENTSMLLLAAAVTDPPTTAEMTTAMPPRNVTGVLHNCTTSVEANCTVPLMLGVCTTECVSEFKDNTVAINYQCIRLESLEQNPLIGILDVAGGDAFCFCYVVEVQGRRRTHLVDCGLRVTRCALADLTD